GDGVPDGLADRLLGEEEAREAEGERPAHQLRHRAETPAGVGLGAAPRVGDRAAAFFSVPSVLRHGVDFMPCRALASATSCRTTWSRSARATRCRRSRIS